MRERERRKVREGNIRLRPCRPTDEEEGAMQKEAAEPRREQSGGKGLRRSGGVAHSRPDAAAGRPGRGRGRAAPCLPAAPAEGVAAAASPAASSGGPGSAWARRAWWEPASSPVYPVGRGSRADACGGDVVRVDGIERGVRDRTKRRQHAGDVVGSQAWADG